MASFGSRIRHFRAPVVVTVALGAWPGCSGETSGDDGDTKRLTACPAEAPAYGARCNYDGPPCEYDLCVGSPTVTAACNDGTWRITTRSCNPPPPPVTVCPVDKPEPGAYCDYAGPACEYDFCGTFATTRATCDTNAWVVMQGTCNPPPPAPPGATDAGARGE